MQTNIQVCGTKPIKQNIETSKNPLFSFIFVYFFLFFDYFRWKRGQNEAIFDIRRDDSMHRARSHPIPFFSNRRYLPWKLRHETHKRRRQSNGQPNEQIPSRNKPKNQKKANRLRLPRQKHQKKIQHLLRPATNSNQLLIIRRRLPNYQHLLLYPKRRQQVLSSQRRKTRPPHPLYQRKLPKTARFPRTAGKIPRLIRRRIHRLPRRKQIHKNLVTN